MLARAIDFDLYRHYAWSVLDRALRTNDDDTACFAAEMLALIAEIDDSPRPHGRPSQLRRGLGLL